jgi:hypothetical protein
MSARARADVPEVLTWACVRGQACRYEEGRVLDLEKGMEDASTSLRDKDKSLSGLIERGNQKSVELQFAQGRATNMERSNRDLLDRVDGLSLLIKQTETKSKNAQVP